MISQKQLWQRQDIKPNTETVAKTDTSDSEDIVRLLNLWRNHIIVCVWGVQSVKNNLKHKEHNFVHKNNICGKYF